jgi:hypothetical protein
VRAIILTALAAALAASAWHRTDAFEAPVLLIVRSDFEGTEAARARARLQRNVGDLLDTIRRRGVAVPFNVRAVQEADLEDNARSGWKPDTIAVIWGNVNPDGSLISSESTIYIGPFQNPMQFNQFNNVPSHIQRGVNVDPSELRIYVIIIGYALLLRVWARDNSDAVAMADVLLERLRPEFGGRYRTAACLQNLQLAIGRVRAKAVLNQVPLARDINRQRLADTGCARAR